ncbi:hypothetical protein D9615_003531 [Tricholomella constricta]|uniref:C2H2-type domain-containing protein n=1 Tax=Tricholomella constricta TaxID=117010 RepID=A0A8H5M6Y8_9AGAR|nr:hypothetical protein D9615_003531 [Tricholomella constricta]
MLSNLLPHHPPHLLIPKYIPDYPQKLQDPSSYFLHPSPAPVTVEDDINSPHSPPSGSGNNFHYAHRSSGSFDSSISPVEMYESNPHPHSYHPPQPSFHFVAALRPDRSYLSESPSPVDPHPSSSYSQIISATQSQDSPSYQPGRDRIDVPSDIDPDRYSRSIGPNRYSDDNNQSTLLDHRRMSEPAILAAPNSYATQSCDTTPSHRLQSQFSFNPPAINQPRPSPFVHSLQRGASMGSLRDVRHAHLDYPAHAQPPYSGWKDDACPRPQQLDSYHTDDGLDGPISPLQPDFSGGVDSSTHGLPYSPTTENHYGPSPPGTGTSTTSSIAPLMSPTAASFTPQKEDITPSARDNSSKTYSFVALPGNTVKKRPRRRYDEIERLYQCSWPDCNKAYGTLNHLNAHVTMQKHGAKRSPNEFKELRKQWRKAKKEASPGPMRRSSVSLRHDARDYSNHRYDSNNDSSAPLYTRQPSYHPSAGLPSSAPSMLTESGDRFSFPVDVDRYQIEERDDHLSAYSAHARQRYSGSTPASWHGRSNLHQQYLSSSLPSQSSPQSFTQHNNSNLPPLDTRMHQQQPQPQHPPHPRPQSPHAAPMNRLPPDSTLLTPLPGYQPPSILPPLHAGDNLSYSAEPGYELYDDSHDGRPHTGHGSIGRSEEEY